MLSGQELFYAVVVPAIVAAAIAGIGCWRKWRWSLALAAGAGFLAGFALFEVPSLPPRDGTDWLFWLAIPLTLLGVLDALTHWRFSWLIGASAAAVVIIMVRPLAQIGVVEPAELALTAAAGALISVGICFLCNWLRPRLAPASVLAALTIAAGGAAVLVFCSGLRIVGIYGLSASAALLVVAIAALKLRETRSVALLAVPLLAGLLAAGRYYAEPGVGTFHALALLVSPALLLAGLIPARRWPRLRVFIALLAVSGIVALLVVPAALRAKAEAESDPYSAYS